MTARASTGSEAPISAVGGSSSPAARATRTAIRVTRGIDEHSKEGDVEDLDATQEERERHGVDPDSELDERVGAQRISPPAGPPAGGVAAESQTEHEGRQHRGDRRARGTKDEGELARPDDLVDKAAHPREQEEAEQDRG